MRWHRTRTGSTCSAAWSTRSTGRISKRRSRCSPMTRSSSRYAARIPGDAVRGQRGAARGDCSRCVSSALPGRDASRLRRPWLLRVALRGMTAEGEGIDVRGCDSWTFAGDRVARRLLLEDRRSMKLVTFDEGRGGPDRGRGDRRARRAVDARVVRARWRRRDGRARRTGRRAPARADRAEEVLPHGRQLPRARGGVEARRLVARDRALDRLLPERRRDRRPGGPGRPSRAPHRGARLRARARGRRSASPGSGSRRRRRRTTSAAT